MKDSVKKEIEQLIKKENLDCSGEEFEDRVNWYYISRYQKLSEDFIREFKDSVDWGWILKNQTHILKETLEDIKERKTTFEDIHKRIKEAMDKYCA